MKRRRSRNPEGKLTRDEHTNFQASVLSNISDAVIVTDSEHHITFWNRAAERLYGYESHEVIGKRLEAVTRYRWIRAEDERAALDSLARTGSWHGENIHLNRSGDEIYVESSVSVLNAEDDKANGFLAIIRDIRGRKRAEEALRESEKRFRKVFDDAPIG